jgi:hypothetical protein
MIHPMGHRSQQGKSRLGGPSISEAGLSLKKKH